MLKIYTFLIFFIFTSLPAEIINKLEITGNQRVSSETIKMFANVTEGNDFDSNDFNTTLKNLYNTNFFDLIELKIVKDTLLIYTNNTKIFLIPTIKTI